MDTVDELTVELAPYGRDPQTGQPYAPHPTQQRIREWVREVRAGQHGAHGVPALYLQHGVNAGGTRAILTPVIEYLLETPGLNILIGRKDFADLRVSGMETFFRMVPPELIVDQNVQEHRYVIRSVGGTSTVYFRELKDEHGLGSQEFAVIAVIEAHEVHERMYRSLKRRCRQGQLPAMLLLEGNAPSDDGHWLCKLTKPGAPDEDRSLTKLVMTSRENWSFMAPSYRKDLEGLPPMYFRRYVMGEVGGLPNGTPVYPSFIERLHVRDTSLIPDRPLLRFWDFGLRATACLWAQQTDDLRLVLHREWCPTETPEDAFIAGVIARTNEWFGARTNEWFGARTAKDYGDPAAAHRDPQGVATLTRLRDQGIHLIYRPSTYGQRIPLINRKLCELVNGQPSVVVSPHCRRLTEGLSGGYHYPTLLEGQKLSVERDKPFHDAVFSHVINAFEYGMVNLYGGASDASRQRQRASYRHRFDGALGQRGATAVY